MLFCLLFAKVISPKAKEVCENCNFLLKTLSEVMLPKHLPTIFHINYREQVNSWKNFWKLWNGPLCGIKSGRLTTQCCRILED